MDTSGEEVLAQHVTSPDQHIFSHVSLDPPPPTGTDVYLCQTVVGVLLIMLVQCLFIRTVHMCTCVCLCMYSNMLLVLHFPVCMFLTKTQSPEEVATDTTREEVFAHHDKCPDQHVTVSIKSIFHEVVVHNLH